MIRPFDLPRRMRAAVASVLLLSATGSYAINTATIVGSVASPDCLVRSEIAGVVAIVALEASLLMQG